MKAYTVGFVFTPDFTQVLLVHKNRPEWQAGKLNALGGKLEAGESYVACVAREIREESGLSIPESAWTEVGAMRGPEWEVVVFTTVYAGDLAAAQTTTDEEIAWYPMSSLPPNTLPNLSWLIPLAIDRLRPNEPGWSTFSLASIEYER